MMTDPIADMLTRIRNANSIERPAVEMPGTKLKVAIAKVLQEEGFILGFRVGKYSPNAEGHNEFQETADYGQPHVVLQVFMKYGPDGERVIRHISRASSPGQRVYQGYKDVRRVLDGLGIAILSTSRGVMSDRQARKAKVGGELIATVW
ncbi:30S ribosomal protein S8 [Limnoglobus roseus]|uniref:Small ribosomal subunit protein uS8 n=1 Tax=Limnoglobus roseus TaxID=2598579 RepID=A0A5C1AKS5_9BACT|nr:30S ribosomal protein S8 [Limnoglobus roseus]QEL19979.1 30S ribosomal protein S8 [Limnoglobus roseus]